MSRRGEGDDLMAAGEAEGRAHWQFLLLAHELAQIQPPPLHSAMASASSSQDQWPPEKAFSATKSMKGPVMKQSDAAWFSGPSTPFYPPRP
ncbi:hypothetical protein NQZ68_020292 [Dissostichus eleginoides]|nr:hypothetical protein NQZ68_020292 [Dissostichus eleginoides]